VRGTGGWHVVTGQPGDRLSRRDEARRGLLHLIHGGGLALFCPL